MKNKVLIAVWGIMLVPAALRGQDSWLISDNHVVNDGDMLWLSFVTGRVFPLGDAPSDPADLIEFVDRCGGSSRYVTGYVRQDRGLSVREPIKGAGIHLIACTLARKVVEIPGDEFDAYLRRERADQALAVREQRGASDGPVREAYTKCAKTIVEVCPVSRGDDGYRVPLGHRLEIIPLSDPCRWRAGATVEVQVRLDGYVWPDVAVSAGHEGCEDQSYAVDTKTDSEGVAKVLFTRPGHWFIKAHFIRPAGGVGGPEWESFWASLTFRVAGPGDVSEVLRMARAAGRTLQPWIVAGYRIVERALGEAARDVFVMMPHAPKRTTRNASIPDASGRPVVSAASASPLASR